MSIATSLTKLETDITNAYNTINTKGGTIPSNKNTENLSTAINSISGGGGGKPEQNKTVTPTTSLQTILPDEGYTLSSVTVNAVDSSIDNNIQDSNIKNGVNILGVIGTLKEKEPKVENPAVIMLDWEGTILKEYPKEDITNLNELPNPNTFSNYEDVDHELLQFQEWNWNLQDIKNWVQNKRNQKLFVGAIYTTTDGVDHNYWKYSKLEDKINLISIHKRHTESFASYVFNNYSNLKSINLPDNITSLGNYACNGCYNLLSLNIPNGVTTTGINSFAQSSALEKVSLPNSLITIANGTFSTCHNLSSINIPDSVTTIGSLAFSNCRRLSSINIPSNLSALEASAFMNCITLNNITIPSTLGSIKINTFNSCKSLIDFVIMGKTNLIDVNAFTGTNDNLKIYVYQENLSWFETATNWSSLYADGKIVTIEDNINYLISIGIDL